MRLQGPSVLVGCLAATLLSPGSGPVLVQARLTPEIRSHNTVKQHQVRWLHTPHQHQARQIEIPGVDGDDDEDEDNDDDNKDDSDATSAGEDGDSTTSSSSEGGGLLGGGDDDSSTSTSSSTTEEDSSSTSTSSTESTSSTSASDDDDSSSDDDDSSIKVEQSTVSDSDGSVSVIDVTSTIQPSGSDSASAASKEDDEEDGGSGLSLGKKALIIIIAVASAVALIAAVWTILRKWKFSPSRRFENRLNPIDWQPEPDDHVKLQSDTASLHRNDSWGSHAGSMRGGTTAAMSERADAYSQVSGAYARQGGGSALGTGYSGGAPAYPPGFNPAAYNNYPDYHRPYAPSPQPGALANPYDMSRQNTTASSRSLQYNNGGRYGEGYNTRGGY